MIKEEKNIDFYTTGRQPSEEEFAQISQWIKKDKKEQLLNRRKKLQRKKTSNNKLAAGLANSAQHQQ